MSFSYWLIALFCLTVLIVIHEYGHFIVARLFKVRVKRFSVGFGPVVWSYTSKKSGTEFALSAIPLGGYISMLDKSSLVADAEKEFCLDFKPIWQRALIVIAGPAANFLSAVIFFMLAFMLGTPDYAAVIGEVTPNSPAYKAGISGAHKIVAVDGVEAQTWSRVVSELENKINQVDTIDLTTASVDSPPAVSEHKIILPVDIATETVLDVLGISPYIPSMPAVVGALISENATRSSLKTGDLIQQVNKQTVTSWSDLVDIIEQLPDSDVKLQVQRDEKQLDLDVYIDHRLNEAGEKIGYLGVAPAPVQWPDELKATTSLPLFSAIGNAFARTWDGTLMIIDSTVLLFAGSVSLDQVAGPIGIAKIMGESSQAGIASLLIILAFLSINLGLLNLLPVPVLDGGHLVFLLAELVGGVKLADLIRNISVPLGFILLLLLTVFVIFNDISHL